MSVAALCKWAQRGPRSTRGILLQGSESGNLGPCLIGVEACGSSHHWVRQFQKRGHEVRLMPATYVKAYVKGGKPDAIDVLTNLCKQMVALHLRILWYDKRVLLEGRRNL